MTGVGAPRECPLESVASYLCHVMLTCRIPMTHNYDAGQVQDAGLIFLSTMASNIVNHMLNEKTHTDEAILATVLCWLAMSTALLGCALWLTGKLQLAAMVQYLPMPVIGGYVTHSLR